MRSLLFFLVIATTIVAATVASTLQSTTTFEADMIHYLKSKNAAPKDKSQDDGPCMLPCILNNGCKCNHTDPYFNDQDNQWYGTCYACDAGWTGPTCIRAAEPCFNGGTLANQTLVTSSCECAPGWQGEKCGTLQCINSAGGSGPHSVAPLGNNGYCENCLPGFDGLNCGMCTADSQCSSGKRCATSVASKDGNKKLSCNVTSQKWINLFSNDRAGVQMNIMIDFNSFVGGSFGSASLTVLRLEPNMEWVDPFFYAKLIECTMTNISSASGDTIQYDCNHMGATCAADPPNPAYTPTCPTSTFQKFFLPILVGKSKFVCNVKTQACSFSAEDLAWEKIPLQCNAGECTD